MTLYDIFCHTQYDQLFYVYLTNVYDQNLPLLRGTRDSWMREGFASAEDIWWHLCDEVDQIIVVDKALLIKVRDENYDKRLEAQYNEKYVARWSVRDKSSRPWLFSAELEDYGYDYGLMFKEEKNEND